MLISNIKCSCVVKATEKWRKEIKKNCAINNFHFTERGNIFIIKHEFSLCIIEKKKIINYEEKYLHLNITGNRNFVALKKNLRTVKDFIFHPSWQVKTFEVDNICATIKYPLKIDLKKLNNVLQVSKFDFERFPAVFYKIVKKGTLLIFENGKINFVGCKSSKDLYYSWFHIIPYLTYCEKKCQI